LRDDSRAHAPEADGPLSKVLEARRRGVSGFQGFAGVAAIVLERAMLIGLTNVCQVAYPRPVVRAEYSPRRIGADLHKRPGVDLPIDLLKVRWQVFLGVAQDIDDGLAIGERQRRPVARLPFLSRQDLPHPLVDWILRGRRERVERL